MKANVKSKGPFQNKAHGNIALHKYKALYSDQESQVRRFAESTGVEVAKVSEEIHGNYYYMRDPLFFLESL